MRERHGHAPNGYMSRTYSSWRNMINRCENAKHESFARYGGRGIKVCARWRMSFSNFLADMGERPAGKTLDRRDNDDNYEPGNCRWATRAEQSQTSSLAKLSVAAVRSIRSLVENGASRRAVARKYGISHTVINGVINGKAWRNV